MAGTLIGELLIGIMGTDPPFGPCRWPIDYSCCQLPDDITTEFKETMEDATVELLWALSGRQFGECGVTLRPCKQTCYEAGGMTNPWPHPEKIDGVWMNLACGSCAGDCSCSNVERVILPSPVTRITEVIIDGVLLPDSAYRVDNRIELIRQDGGSWPMCNDLSKPAGQPGTWSVFGFYGREVPALGRLAGGELTCESYKLCVGDKSCQIPNNWTSISRAGLSISRPASQVAARHTDLDTIPEEWLPWTRRFLRAYNPFSLQSPSTVWSPDIPRPSRTF